MHVNAPTWHTIRPRCLTNIGCLPRELISDVDGNEPFRVICDDIRMPFSKMSSSKFERISTPFLLTIDCQWVAFMRSIFEIIVYFRPVIFFFFVKIKTLRLRKKSVYKKNIVYFELFWICIIAPNENASYAFYFHKH